ncbi:MAG: hypothetical protein E7047_03035 [Lentisphaerae bacterium]|nr:hypothetical protein [Lentisphaerota bacterium]
MINILLTAVMIAALCGMVFCNRKQRKNSKYQLVALGLLVVVIASGGMFMCQSSALSFLGLGSSDHTVAENNRKFNYSQGVVLGKYIKNNFPDNSRILLISPEGNVTFNDALQNELGSMQVEHMPLAVSDQGEDSDGTLITGGSANSAAPDSINTAINRRKNVDLVIAAGRVELKDLKDLDMYGWSASRRPQLIVQGCTEPDEWLSEQIKLGYIRAVVVADPTKRIPGESLPDDMQKVFDSRYVLIHKGNLDEHKAFFY